MAPCNFPSQHQTSADIACMADADERITSGDLASAYRTPSDLHVLTSEQQSELVAIDTEAAARQAAQPGAPRLERNLKTERTLFSLSDCRCLRSAAATTGGSASAGRLLSAMEAKPFVLRPLLPYALLGAVPVFTMVIDIALREWDTSQLKHPLK